MLDTSTELLKFYQCRVTAVALKGWHTIVSPRLKLSKSLAEDSFLEVMLRNIYLIGTGTDKLILYGITDCPKGGPPPAS